MANDGYQQFIFLQGCFNFRDLGGYQTIDGRTVKSRTLFRADSLQFMTAADTAYVESNLSIVTVFDLRNTDEALESGRWPTPDSHVQYRNVPFLEEWDMSPPGPGDDPLVRLSDSYHWVITKSGDRIVEVLTMLAEASNLPAMFHCTAGKDRTGILSAMVLGILGVDDEQIIEDYSLTNQIIDALGERICSRPGNEHRSVRSFEAQPKLIEQILNEVRDTYGGAEGYQPDYKWLGESVPSQPARASTFMLSEVKGWANLSLGAPWRIGKAPVKSIKLYTSDNPVASYLTPVRPWWEEAAFGSLTYFGPLAPDVLLKIERRPDGGEDFDPRGSRRRRDFSVEEIPVARHLVTREATRFL